MSDKKTVEFDTVVNQLVRATKKALDDRKTSIFTIVVSINIFLWGVSITNQGNMETSIQDLKNKNELNQVTAAIAEKKIAMNEYKINELKKEIKP